MIGIVDYGLGNLASVMGAVEKLGYEATISADQQVLADADKLILPGVGAFGEGMRNLRDRALIELLNDLVIGRHRPILGICLGFQLLAEVSEEFGSHQGLGWLPARVRRLAPQDQSLCVPHVGWDELTPRGESPLLKDLEAGSLLYYVHSYVLDCRDLGAVIATCDYGETFCAAVQAGNIYGTQFHPEKSQRAGLKVLQNFLEYA